MKIFGLIPAEFAESARAPILLLAAIFAVGATATGAPPPIQALRAATPPTLDGRLNDACWRNARPATRFSIYRSGAPSAFRTEARICYDDRNLYIGVTCFSEKGSKIKGAVRPHDSGLFGDDHVEVMVDPGKSGENYYQFCVNAYGATWDGARTQAGAVTDRDWNGGWIAKVHRGDDFYSVEIAAPFHTFGLTEKTGSIWGLNVARDSKAPAEMSALATGGAFNEAGKFVTVHGIEVDFRKYCYTFGPAKLRTRFNGVLREAVLSTAVRNRTGRLRKVRIAVERAGPSSGPGKVIVLAPDAPIEVPLETVRWEPLFAHRTDLYVQPRLTARAITVTDAATGETYARSSISAAMFGPVFRSVVSPLRLEIVDPWQRDMGPVKTPVIRIVVHAADAESTDSRLTVTLASRLTGSVVTTRTMQRAKPTSRLNISTADIPWGAYEVRAVLHDIRGRELASTSATATVLPGGAHRIRVLNNLVSELMNAGERGLLEDSEIQFMNPRHGWCFFHFTGGATVRLDAENRPLGKGDAEAMRLLPAGRHSLHIEGRPESLVVRAIPALFYNAHETTPHIRAFGTNTWERLAKAMLPHCNTIESLREYPEAHAAWRRKVLAGESEQSREKRRPGQGGRRRRFLLAEQSRLFRPRLRRHSERRILGEHVLPRCLAGPEPLRRPPG
ncbi:MAG: carbohydrate binding family 9 domain-containing protein [Kiritimatiellaeota bacterium]|nr:carbohydrate binding family 9 domain-containing protein [Kiritimatiellota bacterium]